MCDQEYIEQILSEMRDLIRRNRYVFKNSIYPEFTDLGVDTEQAADFLLTLRVNEYYKLMPNDDAPGIDIHVFRTRRKLNGAQIYTKFFVDEDNELIIQSFKER